MAKFKILSQRLIKLTATDKLVAAYFIDYKENDKYCPTYTEVVTKNVYFSDPKKIHLNVEKPEGYGTYKRNELVWETDAWLLRRTVKYVESVTDGDLAPASGGSSCGSISVVKEEYFDDVLNATYSILDYPTICKEWDENLDVNNLRTDPRTYTYEDEDGGIHTVTCTLKLDKATESYERNITINPTSSTIYIGDPQTVLISATETRYVNGYSSGGTVSVTPIVSCNGGSFSNNVFTSNDTGTFTITATHPNDSSKTATCTITVLLRLTPPPVIPDIPDPDPIDPEPDDPDKPSYSLGNILMYVDIPVNILDKRGIGTTSVEYDFDAIHVDISNETVLDNYSNFKKAIGFKYGLQMDGVTSDADALRICRETGEPAFYIKWPKYTNSGNLYMDGHDVHSSNVNDLWSGQADWRIFTVSTMNGSLPSFDQKARTGTFLWDGGTFYSDRNKPVDNDIYYRLEIKASVYYYYYK